jgi:putative phosphoribosyl transferase
MKRRENLYRQGRVQPDLAGKIAVLVDDGLATGSTMIAAVRYARTFNPAKTVVAAPVGSRQACHRLAREADEVICLAAPEPFFAVGEWYRDFDQVSDAEVMHLLEENTRRLEAYRKSSEAA